ncbi:24067_t:CDS:2 [Cetraspora pellucida]|uniref:24067_t:CDS:1 n=1 Tax=Cetraspora pellucida TaxID=1433469 RepID=A0A9N9D4T7_9GLOM|nr:24067_t:CDS:2 [Cetraspora pellucida]
MAVIVVMKIMAVRTARVVRAIRANESISNNPSIMKIESVTTNNNFINYKLS